MDRIKDFNRHLVKTPESVESLSIEQLREKFGKRGEEGLRIDGVNVRNFELNQVV